MYTTLMLTIALSVAAPKPKEEPKKEAPPKLDGEWAVLSISGGGPKKDDIASIRFTFADGKISIMEPSRKNPEQAAFTADYTKKTPEIDIRPGKPGAPNEEVVKGIFTIKGDELMICFLKGPGERPTEFKSDEKTNTVLITLKRVKMDK